jgi:pimeloyl-ACP methyl ester carboxylesterase
VRLFVHGLHANRSVFKPMMRALQDGTPQRSLNLRGSTVEEMGRELSREIDRVAPRATLDLVAHSLGGIVVRWLVEHHLAPERLRSVVTLGAPHGGTVMSRLLPGRLMRQLRPGSTLLAQLEDAVFPAGVRALSVAARRDQVIRPYETALLPFGERVIIDDVGHNGLLLSRRAHDVVSRILRR